MAFFVYSRMLDIPRKLCIAPNIVELKGRYSGNWNVSDKRGRMSKTYTIIKLITNDHQRVLLGYRTEFQSEFDFRRTFFGFFWCSLLSLGAACMVDREDFNELREAIIPYYMNSLGRSKTNKVRSIWCTWISKTTSNKTNFVKLKFCGRFHEYWSQSTINEPD